MSIPGIPKGITGILDHEDRGHLRNRRATELHGAQLLQYMLWLVHYLLFLCKKNKLNFHLNYWYFGSLLLVNLILNDIIYFMNFIWTHTIPIRYRERPELQFICLKQKGLRGFVYRLDLNYSILIVLKQYNTIAHGS